MAIPKLPYSAAAALLLAALKWIVAGPSEAHILEHLPPEARGERLYLPSPLEVKLLGLSSASASLPLWPRLFSREHPLLPERVPELYTAAFRTGQVSLVSNLEFETARTWSVLVSTSHLNELSRRLDAEGSADKILKKGARGGCPLFEKEFLFRSAQLHPALKPRFASYLHECDPQDILAEWAELETALGRKDSAAVSKVTERLRQRSFDPKGGWATWFAGELVKFAELTK